MHPRAFVISGPSGVGKTSLVHGLLKQHSNLRLSVSTTTRSPRYGEKDGKDYLFVQEEEFFRQAADGHFLEWVFRYGHYYGTSYEKVLALLNSGYHVLMDLESNGAMQMHRIAKGAVFVFIRPPSLEELHQRLKNRNTEGPASLRFRLEGAKQEMAHMKYYQFVIENKNNRADEALSELNEVITNESEKPVRFHLSRKPDIVLRQKAINDAKIQALKAMQEHPVIQGLSANQRQYCIQKVLELIQERLTNALFDNLQSMLSATQALLRKSSSQSPF